MPLFSLSLSNNHSHFVSVYRGGGYPPAFHNPCHLVEWQPGRLNFTAALRNGGYPSAVPPEFPRLPHHQEAQELLPKLLGQGNRVLDCVCCFVVSIIIACQCLCNCIMSPGRPVPEARALEKRSVLSEPAHGRMVLLPGVGVLGRVRQRRLHQPPPDVQEARPGQGQRRRHRHSGPLMIIVSVVAVMPWYE